MLCCQIKFPPDPAAERLSVSLSCLCSCVPSPRLWKSYWSHWIWRKAATTWVWVGWVKPTHLRQMNSFAVNFCQFHFLNTLYMTLIIVFFKTLAVWGSESVFKPDPPSVVFAIPLFGGLPVLTSSSTPLASRYPSRVSLPHPTGWTQFPLSFQVIRANSPSWWSYLFFTMTILKLSQQTMPGTLRSNPVIRKSGHQPRRKSTETVMYKTAELMLPDMRAAQSPFKNMT